MGDVETLWQKHNEHSRRLSDLEITAAVQQQLLDQHTREFRVMNAESVARYTELNSVLKKYSSDMHDFVQVYLDQRGQLMGATRVGMWGIGLILTVVGLGIAFLNATS